MRQLWHELRGNIQAEMAIMMLRGYKIVFNLKGVALDTSGGAAEDKRPLRSFSYAIPF